MIKQINYWWLLPVVTAIGGGLVAWQLYPQPNPEVIVLVDNKVEQSTTSLSVTRVAMPPMPTHSPVAYQATLDKKAPKVKPEVKQIKSVAQVEKIEQAEQALTVREQSGASSELAARFNQALADMVAEEESPQPAVILHPQALTRYPQWYQDLVPSLDFSSHIYSSDKSDRWVKVNQQVVKEGELINANLRLVLITPEQVIIEMQQRQFSLPALSTW